jgi:hypothetical protein
VPASAEDWAELMEELGTLEQKLDQVDALADEVKR